MLEGRTVTGFTKEVGVFYCDGACRNNQSIDNLGAYAWWGHCFGKTYSEAVALPHTTNNIMELASVFRCLEFCYEQLPGIALDGIGYHITIITDSQYVVSGITQWVPKWALNGWKTTNKTPIKNGDLWKRFYNFVQDMESQHIFVDFVKCKGHTDDDGNNYVDQLCNQAMDQYLIAGVN